MYFFASIGWSQGLSPPLLPQGFSFFHLHLVLLRQLEHFVRWDFAIEFLEVTRELSRTPLRILVLRRRVLSVP